MPLNITRFFDELGRSIYADWALQQFNEAAFPSLVEQVLQSQQVHLKLDKEAIINWVLGEQQLPYRTHLNSKFSDLNLTAYANDKFFIELLFWLDGTTTIHQHAFSGAFTVIEGTSIHSDYSFVTQRGINRSLLLGDVQFNAIELLQAGDIRKIYPQPMSAHALFHLNYPNISLVVRTFSEAYAKPQLAYLKPHIAHDPFKNDQSVTQKTQMLKVLSELDQEQYLGAYYLHINKLDLYSHTMIFLKNVPILFKFGALDKALAQIADKDSALAAALYPSALQICKTNRLNSWRKQLKDPHLKFFLAILLNSPNRQTSLQLIEQKYPDQSAVELIIGWIGQLIENEGLTDFDINEQALPFIECLLKGYSFEQTMIHLAQEYDEDELDESRPVLQQLYQNLKNESVLSSLFLP